MTFTEKKRHYKTYFIISLIVLFFTIIISSILGVANISFKEAVVILVHKLPIIKNYISIENIKSNYVTIIWNLRLPRIILAALVGMGLSVSGAAFQGMFKNPMADPYVLGVSTGAALGATIAIVLGIQTMFLGLGGITVMAFIGALITMIAVYNIARVRNKVPVIILLLAGISVNYLLSSAMSIIMILNRTHVEQIVLWLMGSVSAASWKQVYIVFPFVMIGTITISFFARDLNIILMGDESANRLGIEVEKVKKILLFISSIIVAAIVSVSGVIGFVGLVVPHTVRLLFGPDHRVLIPFSAVGGAIFMIMADTLARNLIPPTEIPVGAITSLFGAPYFIYLLIKNKKQVA